MTAEQREQIRAVVLKTPKSPWEYWPFLLPVILLVVGTMIIVGLMAFYERKIPDLEVLFKNGKTIVPVWDSQLIREAVMTAIMSVTVTFWLFIYLARTAFRYGSLLKMAAKDLGMDS
jgi:hypothetical protein